MRVYLTSVALAAVALPLTLARPVTTPHAPQWLAAVAILSASVLNIEVGRRLRRRVSTGDQLHIALSAWAFACAMLLPTWWLFVVVSVTYTHARWRGIRVPLWKWIGSGFYLVLCGYTASAVRSAFLGTHTDWSRGDGSRGFLTMVLAAAVFLALETVLFSGSALINDVEDERFLRAMLTGATFYANETAVLLLGGLFAMVWTADPWFSLFFLPLHVLIQQAVLLAPMRERAAVAAELAGKNAELGHLNQFQTDLLAMLSHELANPLTAVLGYSQIVTESLDEADQRGARSAAIAVDRNARRVAGVLNDIVTLIASDRGTITATPQPLELRARLDSVVAELPAGARPSVECPADLRVLAQPGHLDQILTNLLSNATKYGDGAHRIAARRTDGFVEIVVADRGPGVPEQFRGHLFERYRRDDATAEKVPGTGLGLFISRELARANGGDLTHHDDGGAGSHFVITVPAD
jgi:signal transduction histidine kinase